MTRELWFVGPRAIELRSHTLDTRLDTGNPHGASGADALSILEVDFNRLSSGEKAGASSR